MKRVIWSHLAVRRVIEASEFIADDNPDAASRWADSIFAAAEKLDMFPERGRVVPEVGRREIRELLVGSYRVIYRIAGEEIAILTVRHGRRLFDPQEIAEGDTIEGEPT